MSASTVPGPPTASPRSSLLSAVSVKLRLLGVLGLVVVATLGVGGTGLMALNDTDDASAAVYDEGLVPVVQLAKIRADMKDLRIAILNYVVSTKPEAKQVQKDNMAKAEAAFDADLAAYRPHAIDADVVGQLDAAWAQYRAAAPALLALGDAKDFAAYADKRDATAVPASKAADAALLTLTEKQSSAAKGRADEAHRQFLSGRTTLLSLCLVAALLAVIGGALVARSVIRPLQSVRDALTKVASGDLTARTRPGQGRAGRPRRVGERDRDVDRGHRRGGERVDVLAEPGLQRTA